jgi:hypothetical protein
MLDREPSLRCSFVMMKEPNVGAKIQAFFYTPLHVTSLLLPYNKPG